MICFRLRLISVSRYFFALFYIDEMEGLWYNDMEIIIEKKEEYYGNLSRLRLPL